VVAACDSCSLSSDVYYPALCANNAQLVASGVREVSLSSACHTYRGLDWLAGNAHHGYAPAAFLSSSITEHFMNSVECGPSHYNDLGCTCAMWM